MASAKDPWPKKSAACPRAAGRGLEKLSGPVQLSLALRFAPHLHAPQDLGLQRRPQALDLLQAALAGGFL